MKGSRDMKRKILPVLLAGALVMQSGVGALAEELLAVDEGIFYELQTGEESAETDAEYDLLNENSELLPDDEVITEESVVLEEMQESEGTEGTGTESEETNSDVELMEETDAETEQQDSGELLIESIEEVLEPQPELYALSSTSGTCGANLKWSVDSSDSSNIVLYITGTGAMTDYEALSANGAIAPWRNADETFTYNFNSVVIGEGVTSIGSSAFAGCLGLTSVTLPSTLKTIGYNAFYACRITEVNFPEGLTAIGKEAFVSTLITSAVIPDSVTSLGEGAFGNCASMVNVKLSENLSEIPDKAFRDCSSLTDITIPEGITAIGEYAFSQCTALTNIQLPTSLKTIDNYAFYHCYSLTGVVLPNELISIGNNAFYNNRFTEIVIPATVTSIGDTAFKYCTVSDVYFMGDFPEIGTTPFADTTINLYYFSDASNWNAATIATLGGTITDKGGALGGSCGAEGDNITWSLNRSGLLTISGSGAMEDYSGENTVVPWDSLKDNIREVMISTDTEGSGVTHIGENAFYECKNLQKVTIADPVASIGDGAFDGCSLLKEISLPDTVKSIGAWCFYQCKALEGVTLPDSLTTIGDYAFYECEKLTSAAIPASVSSIGNFAFYGCKNLQQVTMEATSQLTTIGDYAFSCTGITAFEMPDTVETLGLGAFWGTSLKEITLSSSLTVIAGWTFESCPITEIRIPASVTEIRTGAFLNCAQLKQIYFEGNQPTVDLANANPQNPPFDGVTATVQYPLDGTGWSSGIPENWGGTLAMAAYGAAEGTCGDNLTWMLGADGTLKIAGAGAMNDYTVDECAPWSEHEIEITKVIIGDGVTSIGTYAFYNYHSLTSVTLGGQVTEIGSAAFLDCGSLTEVEFPSAVTAISDAAFRMTALKEIVFRGNLPTVGTYAFGVNPDLAADEIQVEYPDNNNTWVNLTNNTLGGIPTAEDVYQFVFVMHEHAWEYTGVKQAATCTETGLNGYICHDCGRTKTEAISMIAHSWDSGRITTAPKCKTSGIRTYTCTSCKGTKTETVAATGHSAGVWTVAQAPSCAIDGTEVRKCKNCGLWMEYHVLDAIGHSFGNWAAASAATVFSPKKEQSTCSACGYVATRNVGKTLSPILSMNTGSLPIQVGKSTTAVKVHLIADGDYIVSWKSSNTSVVVVNSETGKITAKKKTGSATVTVTTAAGAVDSFKVTVQKNKVKSRYMSIVGSQKHTVAKGKKLDLKKTMQPTVYPLTTSEKLTFTSSNIKVATVNSKGVVTAKAAGTVKITMKSGKAKEVVTIVVPKTKTTKITGVKAKVSLKKGKTYTLKPKLTPSNSDEKITYKTSNKKIATVSGKGKIKAKKKGTATITVKSGSVSVKCKVSVK